MAKASQNRPLRFLVTSALLIGPALQGCDEVDPPTHNEPPMEEELPLENVVPPTEAPDPGVEAPIAEEELEAPPSAGMQPVGTTSVMRTNMPAPPSGADDL